MIVFPALDIRGGKVVRLRQGDPTRQLTFADDPLEAARRWKDEGAEWLHVTDLDGSLNDADFNLSTLHALASIGPKIQFGGGLRDVEEIQRALDAGAARVVLGTLVVRLPYIAEEAVKGVGPEGVAVALDARDGRVVTHGWQQKTGWTPVELGQRFAGMGIKYALYTDILRGGEMQGLNVEATAELARETGLHVIASGGVASNDDICRLKAAADELRNGAIAGVVIGRALYDGTVKLSDAIRTACTEPA